MRESAGERVTLARVNVQLGPAFALCALAACSANGPRAPRMPGPGRDRGLDAAAANRRCESCHAQQAAEWHGSPHQRADVDPVYRRAFAIEPMPFCRSCHAPEADPRAPVPAGLASLGVGCVTCHAVKGGAVLAAPGGDGLRAPHPVIRSARFATAAACASCHQFAFPDASLRAHPELMQSTVSEHARSRYASTPCETCHMPRSHGTRSHAFDVQREPSTLKHALRARVVRVGPDRVRFELQSVGVGHAFPTGDLFRRLAVDAEAVGDDYASLARREKFLTRHFRPLRGPSAPRRVWLDDRLGANGDPRLTFDLDLGKAAAGWPIAWRVAYQRVQHPVQTGDAHALIALSVTLAQGVVPPFKKAKP